MAYTFRFYNNLSKVSQNDWEQQSNHLFCKYNFLKTTAESMPDVNHSYIQILENNQIIGCLYIQLVPFKGKELKSYLPESGDSLISQTKLAMFDCMLEKIDWNIAVIGNILITGENGQYFEKNISNKKRWEIICGAEKEIFTNLNADAILITDVYNNMLGNSELLLQNSFRPIDVEPDMVFYADEGWNSFNDYLSSISSKYRVRAKKVFKESKELEIRIIDKNNIENIIDELYPLYLNVMKNVDFKMANATKDYFINMVNAYPENFLIRGYFLENKLISFISYFVDGHHMDVHLVGLDYTYTKSHKSYQRILYDCIDIGIQNKAHHIHFGRTANEMKSTIGAKTQPVKSFIKHKNTLSNYAFKPLTKHLKPEGFVARNPFKN